MHKYVLGVLSVLLVVSLLFVGGVSAQGPNSGAQPFVDEDGDGVCDVCGQTPMGGQGFRGRMPGRGWGTEGEYPMYGGRMGGMWGGQSLIAVAAEVLDVEVTEITALLAEGNTLGEAIVALGGTTTEVVDAFVAARSEALDELVASGRITQEQADAMIAHMREEVQEHLEGEFDCPMASGARPYGGMMGGRAWGGRGNSNPDSTGTLNRAWQRATGFFRSI